MKRHLEILAAVVGVVAGLGGWIAGMIILPTRVAAVERRMDAQEKQSKEDHDTLIRIEERVESVQETLGIPTKKEKL